MFEPTTTTWILSITGLVLYVPAIYIQVFAVWKPHDERTKTMLVGKGGDYFDATYFRFCQGTGWADLFLQLPLVIMGCILSLVGLRWGYAVWFAGAAITIYIHLVLLFVEGRHVYSKMGPFAFFTYCWGLWVYWAIIVIAYCLLRMNDIVF